MKRTFTLAVGILTLSLSAETMAQSPFPSNVTDALGVNIHTSAAKYPKSFDDIKDAGFKIIRTNLYWGQIEKERGDYKWEKYDQVVQDMTAAGATPLFALSFSNHNYASMFTYKRKDGREEKTALPPITPEGIAGFSAFAAEAAKHYKDNHVIWEIWNEPDYIQFWRPEPNGADYARLATAACLAIKKADPNAIVVGPASAGTPSDDNRIDWWRPFLASPALDCLDAISVHPYVRNTNYGPELNIKKYARLRQLIAERTERKIPIISSEFGFSTTDWNVSPERQAALFTRNFLVNQMEGIPVSIWYDWKNDGTDPKNREHNFGIVTKDDERKPVFYAAQTLTRQLEGYRFDGRISSWKSAKNDQGKKGLPDNEQDFVLLFSHSQKPPLLVVWTTAAKGRNLILPKQDLPVPFSSAEVTGTTGNVGACGMDSQYLYVKATEAPQYILLRP